ncbi:hypothetical protein M0R45_004241 [Rubus argutus]|uniref:Uncharacterized protein n=1 Tax=Rubus argutus TaxID=59490 RepID=A0AAW1YJA0_RUBAR
MRKTERNHARIGSNVDIFGNPKLFGNGQRFCAKEVHDEHVEYNDFEDGVCLEEFSFDLGSVERDDEELKIVMAGEVLVEYKFLSELRQRDEMAHSWAAEECCLLMIICMDIELRNW